MSPVNQNGAFTLRSVAPGEYKLFAYEEAEWGSYLDPEILKEHDESAVMVVKPREKLHREVTLAPAREDSNR